MKNVLNASLLVLVVMSSTASAQGWVKWKTQSAQPAPAAQPASPAPPALVAQPGPQPAPVVAPAAESRAPMVTNTSVFDKAECDAVVATAYPINLWAPGLSKKRQELFAACMVRRASTASTTNPSPPLGKAECDAKVATAYPINLWAPGLSQKRKELFAACMATK